MEHSYKQLGVSDVGLLKQLLKVFGEAFNETGVYQDSLPSDDYLQLLLSKPDFIALVKIADDKVVGGLAAYVLEKFEQDRREIFIYDLAVAAVYRRKGIATGLITELKKIAKQKNAYVIFVQADIGDEAAIKLYESLGTKQQTFNFNIPVEK